MEEYEYITYKALMNCDEGSAPGMFTPSYNQTMKINSCKVSTAMDKIPLTNIPNFVVCKKNTEAQRAGAHCLGRYLSRKGERAADPHR